MSARKIVVLGDFGVGKSSLIRRYVLDEFSDSYRATLGVHLLKRIERAEDGAECRLILWDLEGAAVPGPQMSRYIVGAAAAIVVGDLTRADNAGPMVAFAEMVERTLPGRPLGFALNKRDLVAGPNAELEEELQDRFGAPVVETSAKTGDAVPTLFRKILAEILLRGL